MILLGLTAKGLGEETSFNGAEGAWRPRASQ